MDLHLERFIIYVDMQNRCYKQIFSILNNAMNICVNKQQVRTGWEAVCN